MSNQYPGFPTVATHFWRDYLSSSVGMGLYVLMTGALGALVTMLVAPDFLLYYILGGVSLALHMTGMFISDVWKGRYDPSQTSFSSGIAQLLMFITLGVYTSSVLLIGTAGLSFGQSLGLPALAGVLFVAYYPVADITAMRRGLYSPGGLMIIALTLVFSMLFNIRTDYLESLPIVGHRRRPS